ncbi:MAG TPA: 50S ribosomal protein L5 [Acidobacteriota bacterium]|nr:50S ribosomal protein L5 [Acidobacteriota bacterium]
MSKEKEQKEQQKDKKAKAEKVEKPEKAEKADKAPKVAAKEARPERPKVKPPTPRLKTQFHNEILPLLLKRDYKNTMAVPRLRKIVVNMGVGEASKNIKILDSAVDEIGKITGQKAVVRRAKKAISSFKLREGMPIGASVTLRGDRMYEFLDRLISVALPRVRDFKGLSPDSFDGRGNYTIGLKDQLIFPEIDYAKVDKARGMNITVVTSARTDDEARTLLVHLGLPFRRQ